MLQKISREPIQAERTRHSSTPVCSSNINQIRPRPGWERVDEHLARIAPHAVTEEERCRTSMAVGDTNWPLRRTISTCRRPLCHSTQRRSPCTALAPASASAALAGGAITAAGSHAGTSWGATPLTTAAAPPTASTTADAASPAVLSCLARLSCAGMSPVPWAEPGVGCGEPLS